MAKMCTFLWDTFDQQVQPTCENIRYIPRLGVKREAVNLGYPKCRVSAEYHGRWYGVMELSDCILAEGLICGSVYPAICSAQGSEALSCCCSWQDMKGDFMGDIGLWLHF
jgi:hypothetical protein